MLIYQSRANLDVKTLFGKIVHLSVPTIRKCLKMACIGTRTQRSVLVRDLLANETKIPFLKLTIALNLDFNAK